MQNSYQILYPLFALMLLTTAVVYLLVFSRIKIGQESALALKVSRNYSNLFEAPVLFYAIIILIYVSKLTDSVFVSIAWVYVGLRYLHSFIHIVPNIIMLRASVFGMSYACLLFLWVRFFWVIA